MFVYILLQETFWNDVDHVSWLDVIDVYATRQLAKDEAQRRYIKKYPDRAFETLEWISHIPNGLTTRFDVDKYHASESNFEIHGYLVQESLDDPPQT